jgi:hypothetical protein
MTVQHAHLHVMTKKLIKYEQFCHTVSEELHSQNVTDSRTDRDHYYVLRRGETVDIYTTVFHYIVAGVMGL